MRGCWLVLLCLAMGSPLLAGGRKEAVTAEEWPRQHITVTCPWAVGGVADIVNREIAAYGEEVFGQPIIATNGVLQKDVISLSDTFIQPLYPMLGAGGNVALANYLSNRANTHNLILGGESAFAVGPVVYGSGSVRFAYEDYEPIINIYSSIFIMTAAAEIGVRDLESLKEFGGNKKILVAVNGRTSIEAFMAKTVLAELGLDFEYVSYNGAHLALEAVARGEAHVAISHQSQAKVAAEAGLVHPVVVFDEAGVTGGYFKGVKGVGEYGFTSHCRNRAFLMIRAGTDTAIVQKIYDAYYQILQKDEIRQLFDELMIEFDPLDGAAIDRHIAEVKAMVKANL